jgi:MFS family permease
MPRRIKDRNVWLINATIMLVGMGCGMAISIMAVFLDERGYSYTDIGAFASWSALGLVSFSLPAGACIRKYSARATLLVGLVVYSVSVAVFPLVADSFWPAVGVRFVDGAATVAIWVSCETILLSRAGEKHKAYATTLYGISIALGYMIGPFMLWVATLLVTQMPSEAAFYGAGIIVVCTAALVFWRLDEDRSGSQDSSQPELGQSEAPPQTPFSALTWRIKTSCFGTFAYGYFQASVVLFLPLFLMAEKGIAKNDTKMIIGFFALGMLLFSNKAGQLGDRYGHLLLMRLLGVVGTVTVMAFVFLDAFWMMAIAVTLAGATLATISPVSLALQGVIVEPNDYSRSNAIYNAFYAFGMLLGPFLTSRILAAYSGAAMLYHLAALWAVFVVFSIIFSRDDPAARSDSTPESGPSADAFV